MTWQGPERPEWVRLINERQVEPITDEADLPLERDSLLAESRWRAGVSAEPGLREFGGDEFLEPLDIVLADLRDTARLTVLGRYITRRFVLRLLAGRLQIERYRRADPGVVNEIIEAPVVVAGAPRTGTTILFDLLDCDPDLRAPTGWELLWPVPPPADSTPETGLAARIDAAEAELRMLARVTPSLDAIHEYGAQRPKECLSAMSFAFRTEEFTARYDVPTYAAWLDRCDMAPAYAYHRLVLQILQRHTSKPRRWVLKSPVHLHSLPTLMRTYPDARIVVTHRSLFNVLPSLTSLLCTLRWVHSDHVDAPAVAAANAERFARSLDTVVDLDRSGGWGAVRIHHGRYAQFIDDPSSAIAATYEGLALPLSDTARSAMADHLDARPHGRHGDHRYSLDEFGLASDTLAARFDRYTTHFAIP